MTSAYRCDGYGEFYEGDPVTMGRFSGIERDELSADGMSRVLDLCEDCVSEVKTTLDLH
jgi:hypothetical protein